MRHFLLNACALLTICFFQAPLQTYDDVHWFRPLPFFGEPRLNAECMTTFTGTFTQNFGTSARSCSGQKIKLCHDTIPYELTISEAMLNLWQNISHGIYLGVYVPFRELQYTTPQQASPDCTIMVHGLGDAALFGGWSLNYEETKVLDFIDCSLEAGIALPTSKSYTCCTPTTFPIGYNGFTGYFGNGTASLGVLDWITLGGHIQYLALIPPQRIRSQSAPVHATTVGIFGKGDHIIGGLSLLIGFSSTHQSAHEACTTPNSFEILPLACMRSSWTQHTINLAIEYDCTTFDNPYAPRIGLVFNAAYAGKNIACTQTLGGIWDITIAWAF